jgi:hypothetical protein
MTRSIGPLPPYVSTRGLGHTLSGLLLATALAGWIAVGCDFAYAGLLHQVASGETIAQDKRVTVEWVSSVLLTTQTILFIVTAGLFLCWLYLSRANLRAFGMRRMQYPRAWTIGGFLVPALNFVRPYQVVSEVWKASDPASDDAFGWKRSETPALLSIWWGAVVIYAVLELMTVTMHLYSGSSFAKFQLAHATATLADASGAIGASCAFFVVSEISRAQHKKWNHLVDRYTAHI